MSGKYSDFIAEQDFMSLALSPTGDRVAVTSRVGSNINAHLLAIESGESQPLTTFADQSVRSLAWHPDGKTLFFTADQNGDEETFLYKIDVTTGEHTKLLTEEFRKISLNEGALNAAGTELLFSAPVPDPAVYSAYILDLTSGATRQLNNADALSYVGWWSEDGAQIFGTCFRNNTDATPYVWDAATGECAEYTQLGRGELCMPVASLTDGSLIAVSTKDREHLSLVRCATPAAELEWFAEAEWEVVSSAVGLAGDKLMYVLNENGYPRLMMWDFATSTSTEFSGLPGGEFGDFSIARDGSTIVFSASAPNDPVNLYVADVASATARKITTNTPKAAELDALGTCEPVKITAHDGLTIPAYVYRPAGDGPFPVVVSIHGGPEYQEKPRYVPLYQALLSKGIGVVMPNVRGSTGYGKTYQRKILRAWGQDDLRDFGSVHQFVADLEWVDSDRIGVYGGSYGGFAVLSCVSRQPERWACGVDIVGPSNLITLAQSVPEEWLSMVTGWIGHPVDDAEMLTANSPLTHAHKIQCPLFVIQGAHDPRVKKAESDQIVDSLKERGVPVRYDVYEDEGHGFTRRENETKAYQSVLDFFGEHLKA